MLPSPRRVTCLPNAWQLSDLDVTSRDAMKLKVLGCYGGQHPRPRDDVAPAQRHRGPGRGLGLRRALAEEQVKVKDILISHSHLDHTCTLPFLIDNNFSAPGFSLRIYAIPEVIASMKNHLFNNHTWPDFTCLPNDLTPVLKLMEITPEEPFVDQRADHPRRARLAHRAHHRLHRRGQEGARSRSPATPGPPSGSGSS